MNCASPSQRPGKSAWQWPRPARSAVSRLMVVLSAPHIGNISQYSEHACLCCDPPRENPERHRRHDKEVHGDQVFDMIFEGCLPRWGRRFLWPHPVFFYRGFGYINPELAQFPDNPRRAPGGIGPPHALNQRTHLLGNQRSTRDTLLAQAPPVVTEPSLLPGDESSRLHERQSFLPSGPHAREPRPQQSVRTAPRPAWKTKR